MVAFLLQESLGRHRAQGKPQGTRVFWCPSLSVSFLIFLSLPPGSHFSKLTLQNNDNLDPPASTIQILGLPKHFTVPALCSARHKTCNRVWSQTLGVTHAWPTLCHLCDIPSP